MRSMKMVMAKIKALKADPRLKGKPALVQVNAPLALIQVELKAEINALEWVLQPRPKPKQVWTKDEWQHKTLKTEMMGSVERAVWEVERRYKYIEDMSPELLKLYDTAREACEAYESNRRKPSKAQLWSIYYDLAQLMEKEL